MLQTEATPNINKGKPLLSEDWTVVVLGFVIIFLSIAGFLLPVPVYSWGSSSELVHKVGNFNNLSAIALQFLLVVTVVVTGTVLLGKRLGHTLITFPIVYLISMLAFLLASNAKIKAFNLEPVIFSLLLGLLISNVFTLPEWFRSALTTEMFVKIGLIILGTSVVFSDILKAGVLGLVQALIVVVSVWYFAYWLCKKMKLDEELTMMISSAVSICGVSAAIATAGAIQGDPKKLSYVISLVLVTAIPMMVVMPYLAGYMQLSQEVTGAWLGGSIDTTGAVVAAGTLVGETALKISTIVKFSQNVLLGIAAFVISVYWTYSRTDGQSKEKPSLTLIWQRFPKFVLGFLASSLLFSLFIKIEVIAAVKDPLKNIQTLWFVLAFTSIGLETKISDLVNTSGKKPLFAFVVAQLFNILITLAVAYLLFT